MKKLGHDSPAARSELSQLLSGFPLTSQLLNCAQQWLLTCCSGRPSQSRRCPLPSCSSFSEVFHPLAADGCEVWRDSFESHLTADHDPSCACWLQLWPHAEKVLWTGFLWQFIGTLLLTIAIANRILKLLLLVLLIESLSV